jgi:hypothetical protein
MKYGVVLAFGGGPFKSEMFVKGNGGFYRIEYNRNLFALSKILGFYKIDKFAYKHGRITGFSVFIFCRNKHDINIDFVVFFVGFIN